MARLSTSKALRLAQPVWHLMKPRALSQSFPRSRVQK